MSIGDFNQLIVINSDFLKPFAITLTRDQENAKDLIQETMYRAVANRDKYIYGTNIKAWLYTIMRNIFINGYRKKMKQQVIFDSTPNDFILDQNPIPINNLGESTMHQKEIHAEIDGIPDLFKKPFMLYYEGYKYHEIADLLNEPLGTIKSRIHFARKLLKEKIARYS
ncbi:RNA polymerase sigma factor [soil metagenome]